jgi:hypothetical protein
MQIKFFVDIFDADKYIEQLEAVTLMGTIIKGRSLMSVHNVV